MATNPNSIVRILSGIPLDSSYINTLYFNSTTAQSSYFSSKTKYTASRCTYLRHENAIQVDINSDNLYDCNYIMFQNTSYGNKWFYAFITDIEYVSDNNTRIHYEIDSFQTWFLNCELKQSFVEREHTKTDNPGDNTTPEPVETGDYVAEGNPVMFDQGKTAYMIFYTGEHNMSSFTVTNNIDGVFSGMKCIVCPDIENAQLAIDGFGVSPMDDVHEVLAVPYNFVWPSIENAPIPKYLNINRPTTLHGYTPKNKKLYTQQFLFVRAYTGNGATATFAFENFTDSTQANFVINTYANIPPKAMLSPAQGYKRAVFPGVIGQRNGMPEEGLSLDIATSVAWSASAFANMLSNLGSNFQSLGTNLLSNPVSATTSTLSVPITTLHAMTNPPQVQGQNGNNGANLKWGYTTFILRAMCPKLEYIKRIDAFFDYYGYSVNTVKIPNISARPQWNYIKTKNVNLVGNAPVNDINRMKNCFNNGITFWKNPANVGNYNLDNSP